MSLKHRAILPLALAAVLLAGCQNPDADANGAATADGTTASGAGEHGDPLGYCGQAQFQGEDIGVYLASDAATCSDALDLAERAKDGPQGTHTSGYPQFGTWRCLFTTGDEFRTALAAACWQGETEEASVLLRPADIDTMPGFQRSPFDFGTGRSWARFTTPSGDFQCAIQDGQLGCDAMNGMPPDAPLVEDRLAKEEVAATTIVLPRSEPAEFEHHDKHVYAHWGGESYGGDTAVLNHGEVLHFDGYSCTADEVRDVVCIRGEHGFEISTNAVKTS